MLKRLILILFVCISPNLKAQNIVYDNDPLLENFAFQVRQIGEFMSRLNGETSLSENVDTFARRLDIASLFKMDVYLENKQYAEDFTNKVLPDNLYVSFCDTTWHATAKCVVDVKSEPGKEEEITLVLKTAEYGPYLYKWVIVKAYGDFLNLIPDKVNPGLRISPTDNEVNFMSLSHISRCENRNILNFAVDGFIPDTTTVFYTMLYNGIIEIKHVSELSYTFNDIQGYRINVNYYPGDQKNCGWLISDIQPNINRTNKIVLPLLKLQ